MTEDQAAALVAQAGHYRDIGRYAQARELLSQVLGARPDDVAALVALGWTDYLDDRDASALRVLGRARAVAPDDPVVLIAYAYAAESNGARTHARQAAERAVAVAPEDPAALCALAQTCRFRQPRRALKLLERAAAVDPDYSEVRRVRPLVLRRLLRFGQARAAVRARVAADPEDPAAQLHLSISESSGLRIPRAVRAAYAAAAAYPAVADQARAALQSAILRLLFLALLALGVTTIVLVAAAPSTPQTTERTISVPAQTLRTIELPPMPTLVDPENPAAGFTVAPGPPRTITVPEWRTGTRELRTQASGGVQQPIRPWARIFGGAVILLIASLVASTLRAVPRGGWPVMRKVVRARGTWTIVWLVMAVVAFVSVTLAVATGDTDMLRLTLIPTIWGIVVGAYVLVRGW